jgi:hypothetical protein
MTKQLSRLKISENKRFLVKEDGMPFFYLGDTAWTLFHRLNLAEAEFYLKNRADKQFTVIQATILSELRDLEIPNVNGDTPLINNDSARPNEAYFQHVDAILSMAADYDLYVALMPTWGSYVIGEYEPAIFGSDNAYLFGRFVGERYREMTHLMWINGGDRLPIFKGKDYAPVWRALARGVKEGYGQQGLMTFHPPGAGNSSSLWFHGDDWLDFNMVQTGPRRNFPNCVTIEKDYLQEPVKPTLDGEPGYERARHRMNRNPHNPRLTAHDVRKYAYWALFAGAFGHTYGCLEVWQMFSEAHPALNGAKVRWTEALELPGAGQMQYVRRLIESRPFLMRIPDENLVTVDPGYGHDHVRATRGSDGSYAFIYIPTGKPVAINLDRLKGDRFVAYWYDPRLGVATPIGEILNQDVAEFIPPTRGPEEDWVLVLDDVSKNYPAPGASQ